MNENNTGSPVENEESKGPIYSSRFTLTRDLFYDFSSVGYHGTKKTFLIFFCLETYLIGINLYVGNYDLVFGFGPFISFLMTLLYIKINKSTKIGYERMLLSEGKEPSFGYALFDDKIVSYHEGSKNAYSYRQISRLFETKSFILLHLKHQLYVTIEKSNLNACAEEVKAFLLNKPLLVKKKKFIKCTNDKQWSLIFLIALIAVSVAGVVIGAILRANLSI